MPWRVRHRQPWRKAGVPSPRLWVSRVPLFLGGGGRRAGATRNGGVGFVRRDVLFWLCLWLLLVCFRLFLIVFVCFWSLLVFSGGREAQGARQRQWGVAFVRWGGFWLWPPDTRFPPALPTRLPPAPHLPFPRAYPCHISFHHNEGAAWAHYFAWVYWRNMWNDLGERA